MKETHQESLKSYILGFILSILLTGAAYITVANHLLEGPVLVLTLIGLGLLQAFIQLLLFLHLGQETKPRWNLTVFLFMLLVLFILVLGSLWIMYHLNYNMTQ